MAHVRARKAQIGDDVEANLPPELVSLWRRERRWFKGSANERYERFLHWVHDSGDRVVSAHLELEAERAIDALVAAREASDAAEPDDGQRCDAPDPWDAPDESANSSAVTLPQDAPVETVASPPAWNPRALILPPIALAHVRPPPLPAWARRAPVPPTPYRGDDVICLDVDKVVDLCGYLYVFEAA